MNINMVFVINDSGWLIGLVGTVDRIPSYQKMNDSGSKQN